MYFTAFLIKLTHTDTQTLLINNLRAHGGSVLKDLYGIIKNLLLCGENDWDFYCQNMTVVLFCPKEHIFNKIKRFSRTQKDHNGVDLGSKSLWLLRVQRETNAIGSIEVFENPFKDQWQESNNKAQDPDNHQNGNSASAARGQVPERVDNADVFLQGEVCEEKHWHLCWQHG